MLAISMRVYDFREINDVTAVCVASHLGAAPSLCAMHARTRICNHVVFFSHRWRRRVYDELTGSNIGRLRINTVGYLICSFTRHSHTSIKANRRKVLILIYKNMREIFFNVLMLKVLD